MGRRSRKRAEEAGTGAARPATTRAERDAARRARAQPVGERRTLAPGACAAPARRPPAGERAPAGALGQLPALGAGHPARHRRPGLGRLQRARAARSGWRRGSCSPRSAAASWRCASISPASARTARCWRASPPFAVITVLVLGLGSVKLWLIIAGRRARLRRLVLRLARAVQAPLRRPRFPLACRPCRTGCGSPGCTTSRCSAGTWSARSTSTATCSACGSSSRPVNEDDRDARHLFFGDEEGRPGTIVTCLEYPDLEEGRVGAGTVHHFALAVESEEQLGRLARLPRVARASPAPR